MKKEFSFIIGEGKNRLSCLDEFDKQKRRVMENDKCCEFIGEPQFFEPTKSDEKWFAYQQYTYETDGELVDWGIQTDIVEGYVEGIGSNFFLCCCDLNNRIRLKRQVARNVKIVGVPQFIIPSVNQKLWKVVQKYTYEPQMY